MKEPRTTTPGSKERWEMRIRITRRKMRAREDVAISNGKSLFFFLSLSFFSNFFYVSAKWGTQTNIEERRKAGGNEPGYPNLEGVLNVYE